MDMGQMTGWKQKGVQQGCILSLWLFNVYEEYNTWNAALDESQGGVKICVLNHWCWERLKAKGEGDWRGWSV